METTKKEIINYWMYNCDIDETELNFNLVV